MKLFQGSGFQVIYEKESEELKRALELLPQCRSRLQVTYEDRRLFLTPFVHFLVGRGNTRKMEGTRRLARLLHLIADFKDADGGTNTLNLQSIEDELYKLHVELYPEE